MQTKEMSKVLFLRLHVVNSARKKKKKSYSIYTLMIVSLVDPTLSPYSVPYFLQISIRLGKRGLNQHEIEKVSLRISAAKKTVFFLLAVYDLCQSLCVQVIRKYVYRRKPGPKKKKTLCKSNRLQSRKIETNSIQYARRHKNMQPDI